MTYEKKETSLIDSLTNPDASFFLTYRNTRCLHKYAFKPQSCTYRLEQITKNRMSKEFLIVLKRGYEFLVKHKLNPTNISTLI